MARQRRPPPTSRAWTAVRATPTAPGLAHPSLAPHCQDGCRNRDDVTPSGCSTARSRATGWRPSPQRLPGLRVGGPGVGCQRHETGIAAEAITAEVHRERPVVLGTAETGTAGTVTGVVRMTTFRMWFRHSTRAATSGQHLVSMPPAYRPRPFVNADARIKWG